MQKLIVLEVVQAHSSCKFELPTHQKRYKYFFTATKHYQWHFPTQREVDNPRLAKARADKNAKAQTKKANEKVNVKD